MAAVAVKVTGVREIRAALKQAEEVGLLKEITEANKAASEIVVERALPKVPVRSGALRSSVKALASQATGRVRAGSGTVPYAAAIHWGRKVGNVGWPPGNHMGPNRIAGRPFLWDAAREATPAVVDEYRDHIEDLLRQMGDMNV